MAIEQALAHARPKPWGISDLHPWSNARHDGGAIGEIWYERPGRAAAESSLLLKMLFTSQPLSIQVHPDDVFAHSIGLPNGKTEAWYVLSAAPDAKVALGLNRRLRNNCVRQSMTVRSRTSSCGRTCHQAMVFSCLPGRFTRSARGLVIAEIQQRSDATFRLFDYGRQRELHIENAVAVANVGPAQFQVQPDRLTDERTLLVSSPNFVFERIELAPNSAWSMETEQETWLLVIRGGARAGSFDFATGDAIFVQSDRVDIHTGPTGMVGLAAYTDDGPARHLLQRIGERGAMDVGPPQATSFFPRTKKATPTNGRLDLSQ